MEPRPETPPDTLREVEDLVERAGRRRAALVVGVRRPDGAFVHGRSREGPAPDGRTLFEIGSVTKTFTSLLLADGVVRGDWTLDDPVRDLLPAGTVVPARDGVEITLEHLATHASGLPGSPVPLVRGSVEMLRGRDPYAGLTPDGLLTALAQARLRRTPGTGGMHYSNLGVLGQALAHAAGTSYGALVEERVCRPLGLVDTATHDRLTDEQRTRLAPGHRGRGRPAPAWPLDGLPGAGALRSTTEDLLRYLDAWLEPDSTPLGDAVRLCLQPRVEGRQAIGLGWLRNDRPPPLWWHNGGTGGYRSFVGFVPEARSAVAVLCNHARSVDLLGLQVLRVMGDGGPR
ncbi:serine hydrolase domain-containing protein [Nocardioides sediminis]|uniref:serine hydrolase domain-containing protein n=1 Tax=Nocardioides sediminis TaxID=433648 RepID=UPI00131EF217|nr:serine hydrolase domain-containing protein [Nocardioides sediminis]